KVEPKKKHTAEEKTREKARAARSDNERRNTVRRKGCRKLPPPTARPAKKITTGTETISASAPSRVSEPHEAGVRDRGRDTPNSARGGNPRGKKRHTAFSRGEPAQRCAAQPGRPVYTLLERRRSTKRRRSRQHCRRVRSA
ncbi:hypothetical protein IscW_ISCW012699, partial [Ixodes scapularis]